MVGPLVYDVARQHVAELLSEREMDRLAAQAPRKSRHWAPSFDIRRLLPPLSLKRGSAPLQA